MIDYLAEIKRFHAESVQPFTGKAKGCTDREIREIEAHFGAELPLAYKQYLKFMGKDYYGVFTGSNWFVGNVIENTEWLPRFLAENKIEFQLPANYLVFFSHGGNTAAWFHLPKEADDPVSWFLTESNRTPRSGQTFTQFLFKDMKATAGVIKNMFEAEGKTKRKSLLGSVFDIFKRR